MATFSKQISLEEFKKLLSNSEVTCQVCKIWSGHGMVRHLQDAHKLSPGQYKKQFPKEQYPAAKLLSPVALEILKRLQRFAHDDDNIELNPIAESFGLIENIRAEDFSAIKVNLPKQDQTLIHGYEVPVENKNFKFPSENTQAVLLALSLGKNVYISGPTGCGKTELYMQIHHLLQRPALRANMNGDMTAAKFLGARGIDPAKGTYYKYGMLPLAMKAGSALIIDEVDYTPPQIATVMNPVLEGKRMLYIEETDETIHAQPGFVILATGNTAGKGDVNGNYSGTEIMNTAFLDRFPVKLNADYLAETDEIDLIEGHGRRLDHKEVSQLVKMAGLIRNAMKEGQLSITVSTRKLLDYADFRNAKPEPYQALSLILLNWLDESDRPAVSEMVKKVWPGIIPEPKANEIKNKYSPSFKL